MDTYDITKWVPTIGSCSDDPIAMVYVNPTLALKQFMLLNYDTFATISGTNDYDESSVVVEFDQSTDTDQVIMILPHVKWTSTPLENGTITLGQPPKSRAHELESTDVKPKKEFRVVDNMSNEMLLITFAFAVVVIYILNK